ncbi:uncharacterized protein PB18E9.04c-like [Homarus americanus]|uniref:uncharacterized protein PB18E9.04c-like n=1 Tax=Homarus americanus TaxID=6706 RepID=UPI001C43E729|nr:uncharacterized protein PB18E9.04c-like [Homarus americanus]
MPCAPGTVWDQNLLTCNHQHSTQCVTGNYVGPEGNCVGCVGCTSSTTTTTTTPSTTTRPNFPCVDCSSGQQYFQHPTDCHKFIQCAPYGPQEMPCAPGTVWDQNLLTCNHQHSTQCVTGNYVGPEGNCVGCVGCTSSTTTTTTSPSTTTRPNFPCVDCSSGQQYFQHPTDCHKFIQCAPYGPQEMPCAPGTVWDQNLLTCNHQHSTQCVTGNYVDSDGNCVGCVGCTPITNTTTTTTTTPSTTTRPYFPCVDCSIGQQYFQHPTDCHKFIQCAPYGPQEMPCAPGTVWDQNLLTCNHQHSTQCVTGNYVDSDGNCVGCVGCTPITNTTTTTTTTPTTTNRPNFPCIDCSSGQQYFQHPTDCHKFIQCAPYGPQEMPCAPGTVWDQNLLTCNHQHSTQCV